jgi:hypothetical protein
MTDGYLTFGLDELKEIIEITFRLKEAALRFQKPCIILWEAVLKPIIDLFPCLLLQNGDSFLNESIKIFAVQEITQGQSTTFMVPDMCL